MRLRSSVSLNFFTLTSVSASEAFVAGMSRCTRSNCSQYLPIWSASNFSYDFFNAAFIIVSQRFEALPDTS